MGPNPATIRDMLRNKKVFMSFIYRFAIGWKEVFEKGVTLWENTVKEAPCLNRK